jgi:hypothetical protein
MLTIKLIGSSKLTWKNNNLPMKIPLPVLAVAVSKPRAMSCELTCSQPSSKIAQSSVTKVFADTGSGCEQALGHEL